MLIKYSAKHFTLTLVLAATIGIFTFGIHSSAQASGFYKWVDDNGVVQYTQLPPTNSQPADQIQTYTGGASDEDKLDELNRKLAEDIELRKQKDAERGLSEEDLKLVRQMRLNCQVARTNLAALEDSANVRFQDAAGNITTFSPEERSLKTQNFRSFIADNCQDY